MSTDASLEYVEKVSEKIVGRLIDRIRKQLDPQSCQRIQLEILAGILHSERQIKKAKQQKLKLRNQIKSIIQKNGNLSEFKTELKKIGSRIKLSDDKIFAHRRRIDMLRLLGTSIAYCFIDRNTLLNLGQNQPPGGYLIDKEGLTTEIRVFKRLCSSPNSIAILNDITSCLTIGDITSINNGRLIVCEVKSSQREHRISEDRQISRMKATTEFLNTQIDKGPGSETRILEIEQSDKHNWKELREVLLKARKDGFSYKIVEGCLVYVAYRTDSFDLDEALSKAEFPWHKKSVLTVGSLCRHIEGTRVKPLTLFPIETSLILDILFC